MVPPVLQSGLLSRPATSHSGIVLLQHDPERPLYRSRRQCDGDNSSFSTERDRKLGKARLWDNDKSLWRDRNRVKLDKDPISISIPRLFRDNTSNSLISHRLHNRANSSQPDQKSWGPCNLFPLQFPLNRPALSQWDNVHKAHKKVNHRRLVINAVDAAI